MKLAFFVEGRPAPQGSKKHVGNGRLVEQSVYVAPWRSRVAAEAELAAIVNAWQPATGPVVVCVTVWIARPKSHSQKVRTYPTSQRTGDADKHSRSILDALTTSGVIADDSLVIELHASKHYVHPEHLRILGDSAVPGAHIEIHRMETA